MRVLVVEDDPTGQLLLCRILESAGYTVTVAGDGEIALCEMESQRFDAVITDWMMPKRDGIDLVRSIRAKFKPCPILLMVTAIEDDNAKGYAFASGVDGFVAKPIVPKDVLRALGDCFAKQKQKTPSVKHLKKSARKIVSDAPFFGVGIGASTGGPVALEDLVSQIQPTQHAAFYIVLHGPAWMLESFANSLQRIAKMPVMLAQDGMFSKPGTIYLAPGDVHMVVERDRYRIRLEDSPPENFVRPAIDPLFRSLANVFASRAIGVILTGMGKDGVLGCGEIANRSGTIFVQDPQTALIASMPKAVAGAAFEKVTLPLEGIGLAIGDFLKR